MEDVTTRKFSLKVSLPCTYKQNWSSFFDYEKNKKTLNLQEGFLGEILEEDKLEKWRIEW